MGKWCFTDGCQLTLREHIEHGLEDWHYGNLRTSPEFDGGKKNDKGKARYDLLAPDALRGLVDVLTFGSKKYNDRNWEKGIVYGRVFAAAMRHLWAWWRGEENDPETGLSHLDHAACCIHFLSAYTKRGMNALFDDRNHNPTAAGWQGEAQ